MICPNCNHPLPEDSKFCNYCGVELSPAAAAVRQPSSASPADFNSRPESAFYPDRHKSKPSFCRYCGKMIDSEGTCSGCGRKYFRMRQAKSPFLLLLLLVLFIGNILLFIATPYSRLSMNALYDQLAKKEQAIQEIDQQINTYQGRASFSQNNTSNLQSIIEDYEKSAVLVCPDNPSIYHTHYTCEDVYRKKSLQVVKASIAGFKGYFPCPKCSK